MYNFISNYYDTLFPEKTYADWKCFARPLLQKSKALKAFNKRKEKPLIIDAGCGSGKLSALLAKNYDVIGIDISEDMLCEALENYSEIQNITWVCQDISKMNIGRKAAAVFSITDTLNHITNQKKLFSFFKRAYESLEFGGYLFFDVVTPDLFKNNYSKTECSFEDFEWGTFFWTSQYSEKTGRVVYDITAFERLNEDDNIYERTDEQVIERVWSLEVLKEGLLQAGFSDFTVYDSLRNSRELMRFSDRCDYKLEGYERLYFVCEKN